MRSIVLAGLLGTGALMTSGCGIEDVKDALDINTGSVALFNDTAAPLDITVNSEVKTVAGQNIIGNYDVLVTQDDHTVNISYPGAASTLSFNNSGATYVYAAAPDCTNGYVLDVVGTEKLRVMNLSGGDILNSDLNISRDGVKIDLPSTAFDCTVTSTYTGATDGNWSIEYKGVDLLGVGAYESTNDSVKIEVVVYDVSGGNEAGGIVLLP